MYAISFFMYFPLIIYVLLWIKYEYIIRNSHFKISSLWSSCLLHLAYFYLLQRVNIFQFCYFDNLILVVAINYLIKNDVSYVIPFAILITVEVLEIVVVTTVAKEQLVESNVLKGSMVPFAMYA